MNKKKQPQTKPKKKERNVDIQINGLVLFGFCYFVYKMTKLYVDSKKTYVVSNRKVGYRQYYDNDK